jgi:hypothetical protein
VLASTPSRSQALLAEVAPMSITACVAVTSAHWPKEPRMGFRHSGHVITTYRTAKEDQYHQLCRVVVQDRAAITQFRRSSQAVGLSAEPTSDSA